MGSGKGQARRTQAVKLTAQDTFGCEGSWPQFIADAQLEETSLADYYLGSERARSDYGRDGRTKIITELFKDMVAIGALSLPEGWDVEDFELQEVDAANYSLGTAIQLTCKKTSEKELLFEPNYYLNPRIRIDSRDASAMMGMLAAGLQSLIRSNPAAPIRAR